MVEALKVESKLKAKVKEEVRLGDLRSENQRFCGRVKVRRRFQRKTLTAPKEGDGELRRESRNQKKMDQRIEMGE